MTVENPRLKLTLPRVSLVAAALEIRLKLPPTKVNGRPPKRLVTNVPELSSVSVAPGFTVAAIVLPPARVPAAFKLTVP